MNARRVILSRIRQGLRDVTEPAGRAEGWVYGRTTPIDDVPGRFVERTSDYKARVERVAGTADVPATLTALLTGAGVRSTVCPPGLPDAWRRAVADARIEVHGDEPP